MPPMWPPLRASQLLAAFRQILQALLSLKDKIGNDPPKNLCLSWIKCEFPEVHPSIPN